MLFAHYWRRFPEIVINLAYLGSSWNVLVGGVQLLGGSWGKRSDALTSPRGRKLSQPRQMVELAPQSFNNHVLEWLMVCKVWNCFNLSCKIIIEWERLLKMQILFIDVSYVKYIIKKEGVLSFTSKLSYSLSADRSFPEEQPNVNKPFALPQFLFYFSSSRQQHQQYSNICFFALVGNSNHASGTYSWHSSINLNQLSWRSSTTIQRLERDGYIYIPSTT